MSEAGDGDRVVAFVVCAVAAATVVVYIGAAVAALLTHATFVDANAADALRALVELARRPGDPRQAWPPATRNRLPGPVPYWCCTVVVALGATVGATEAWARYAPARVGTTRRRRLGVEVRGRLATVSEVRPLIVKGATRGRFVLGRVHGRLVATEHPDAPSRRRFRRTLADPRQWGQINRARWCQPELTHPVRPTAKPCQSAGSAALLLELPVRR